MSTQGVEREHGELLRSILDAALDAVIVMDARGLVAHWNKQAEAIFGWTRDEAVGQPLASLVIPPRYRDAHTQGLRRFLATGAGPVLNRRVELTAVRRDGREFPVELTVTPFPLGGEAAFTGFVRDITERQRAEAGLRASEALSRRRLAELRAIYATAPVGLCFTDPEHRYVSVNERMAAINGLPAEAHLGRTVGEVLPAPLAEASEAIRRRVIATGEPALEVELRGATAADGRGERHWLASYYPVHGSDGTVLGVNTVVQDVTERRRAEEQRELLLAELSHRVKNLLAIVQAVAEQTGRRAGTMAGFLAAFRGRLGALAAIHDLLAASDWQGVSLPGLARATLAPYLDGDDRVGLEVADLALKPSAAQALALVLHELATNAEKHGALSAAGGRVAVTARVERGGDGGDELGVIWEETGGPPVRRPERAGFGTTLLAQAIEYQHGGQAELEWREEGVVCRLRMPLAEAMTEQARRG